MCKELGVALLAKCPMEGTQTAVILDMRELRFGSPRFGGR